MGSRAPIGELMWRGANGVSEGQEHGPSERGDIAGVRIAARRDGEGAIRVPYPWEKGDWWCDVGSDRDE